MLREKKNKSMLKRIVVCLLLLVLAIPAAAFGYLYTKLNSIHDSDIVEKPIPSLDTIEHKAEDDITNILLVGTDGRTTNDSGTRSDAIMILTVDKSNKTLKLTSLARDSYVDIEGHGMEKLTHAYYFGGINLLVDTVETNFKLDIQDYIYVDFFAFMDIVDVLGGVEVDVKSKEIKELYTYTRDCYNLNTNPNKGSLEYINNSGVQKLNGYQALAYARIRYTDDAIARDARQRAILQGVANGILELPLSQYNKLLNSVLPYVKTSMSPTKIIGLGTSILGFGSLNIEQLSFPVHDGVNSTGGIVGNDGWVLQFDESTLHILHDFIFGVGAKQ